MKRFSFDKRTYLCASAAGLLFSFFATAGYVFKPLDGIERSAKDVKVLLLFLFLAVAVFTLYLFLYYLSKHITVPLNKKTVPGYFQIVIFFVLIFAWLAVFLSLGPRITDDSCAVITMALEGGLNDAHPILYTLLFKAVVLPFRSMGSISAGVYTFCALQMLFSAYVLSLMLTWLRKKCCSLVFCIVSIIFFSAFVFAGFSVTIWKDIPFNAVFLLLIMQLFDIGESGGKALEDRKNVIRLTITSVFMCFLRGNGWLVVFCVTVVLILAYRKSFKRFAIPLAAVLIVVKIVTGPIYGIIGIQSRMGTVEQLAMPIQQVALSIKQGAVLSEEQRESLSHFIEPETMAELYQSSSVDYIKGSAEFDRTYFNNNTGEFLKLWLQLMPSNAGSYVKAMLLETAGYWRLGFDSNHSLWDSFNGFMNIDRPDLINKAFGIDFAAFVRSHTQMIISLSAQVWILLYSVIRLINERKYRYLLPLTPIVIVWVGLMFGAPSYAELRYLLVLPYALPIVFYLLIYRCTKEQTATESTKLSESGTEKK